MFQTPAPGTALRKLVLLLVSDDSTRATFTDTLELAGYRIVSAENGQSALSVLSQLRPHLVLLDLTVEGTIGWDVLAELSSSQALASVPIVALAAYPEQALSEVDHVLSKPVDLDELVAVVERLCR